MKTLIFLCILTPLYAAPIDQLDAIYGDHFEGDIILTPEQEELIKNGRNERTGIADVRSRWPKINGSVQVPYVIDSNNYSQSDINVIRAGMDNIEAPTCIRFVPRSNQTDYIRIFNGNGCWSFIGKIGDEQTLSLSRYGCIYNPTVMHVLIHALGFQHMHQHPDRNSKIRINWQNIEYDASPFFVKIYEYNNFGTPYDISSIMHYTDKAYSKNGRNTITAINPADQNKIGGKVLTSGDITRLRNMYQC